MPTLLIVHHTASPSLEEMLNAVSSTPSIDPDLGGVTVLRRAALTASPVDVLEADAYLLGTPANIGYMSGALKHFFDQVYYPCRDQTAGRRYGLYVHGGSDVTGAVRGVESIATGMGWRKAAEPVVAVGAPGPDVLARCAELGARMAAGLLTGIW